MGKRILIESRAGQIGSLRKGGSEAKGNDASQVQLQTRIREAQVARPNV